MASVEMFVQHCHFQMDGDKVREDDQGKERRKIKCNPITFVCIYSCTHFCMTYIPLDHYIHMPHINVYKEYLTLNQRNSRLILIH